MSEVKHTPTPWVADGFGAIKGGPFRKFVNGEAQEQIAMVCAVEAGPEIKKANTEFIIRCANSHGDLTEALKSACTLIDSSLAHVSHGGPTREEAEKCLSRMLEALAKAGRP